MAGVSWDGIPGTDRHVVSAMTSFARILWVDPAVSPVRQSLRTSMTGRAMRPVLSQAAPRIARLTPCAFPGFTKPIVRLTTTSVVRWQIVWALRRLGVRPMAVVATHLDGALGNWDAGVTSVLYGTDDYVAGARLMGLSVRRQIKQERRSLAKADRVAAVSLELVSRWAEFGPEPEFIPNGCWPQNPARKPRPPSSLALTKPVVGLVGQLSDRIDLSILEAIAEAGHSLLIVGPLDPRCDCARFYALASRPGVHYAGPVVPSAVPNYLAAMDIGITPYRDTSFNRASFPLKTLEYLAAGLPVITADLPAARWLRADLDCLIADRGSSPVLELADSPSAFVAGIRRLTDAELASRESDLCIAFAERHSWPNRARQLASIVGLVDSNDPA